MKKLISILSVLFCLGNGFNSFASQSFDLLDETEHRAMAETFQYALENNPTSQDSEWVNPDTAHSGEVTPIKTFYNSNGDPCREFTQTIIIGEREEQGYGTACRQPDGIWQIVSDQGPAAVINQIPPVEKRTIVYIHDTPWPNYFTYRRSLPYGYRYPYYYPGSFSFNFNYPYHRNNYYKRNHINPRYKIRTDFDHDNRSWNDRRWEERDDRKYRDKKKYQQHWNKNMKRERREEEREGRR